MANGLKPIGYFKRYDIFYSKYFNSQSAHRYLFELTDGTRIESSLYEHYIEANLADISIDISTMVGCPMQCRFCASATTGFIRDLSSAEMVEQVMKLTQLNNVLASPKIVCSFQGIGEPSINYREVLKAGFQLLKYDARCVLCISTMGKNLEGVEFWRKQQLPIESLQFSIPGVRPELLDWLIPTRPDINKIFDEISACSSSSSVGRVTINYILIENLNDSEDDIELLIEAVKHLNVVVKISSLNTTSSSAMYSLCQPSKQKAEIISSMLTEHGINNYIFGSFNNINISCGQLINDNIQQVANTYFMSSQLGG